MKKEIKWSDIKIGDVFSFERKITAADMKEFAALSGDRNPLHLNKRYAGKTIFKKPIAQGMFLAGFFSALIGNLCPGRRGLYLSQTLSFRSPVYPGETVLVCGQVVGKSASVKIVTLETVIKKGDRVVVSGKARASFLNSNV